MEWLLIIVLVSSTQDMQPKQVRFETQHQCIKAAEAFVEKYPVFELRDHANSQTVETPVVRSYVECIYKP